MILNGSAHVFLILKKNNKQFLIMIKVHKKKLGMLNVIKQLQHFILCNMMWSTTAFVNIAFQCSITHHIALNEVQ